MNQQEQFDANVQKHHEEILHTLIHVTLGLFHFNHHGVQQQETTRSTSTR